MRNEERFIYAIFTLDENKTVTGVYVGSQTILNRELKAIYRERNQSVKNKMNFTRL